MALAEFAPQQSPGLIKTVSVPHKNSVVVLGPFEPKYKFISSLYVALSKLSELEVIRYTGIMENNVFSYPHEEMPFARIVYKNKRIKEVWVVGVPSEVSSKMLGTISDAIKSLRGELPEGVEEGLDEPKALERLLENSKNFVYVFDGESNAYAQLELSNFLAALEGRKVDKVAVAYLGRGLPPFVHKTLEAMNDMGVIKRYTVIETTALNSFEMLKLAKFVFL